MMFKPEELSAALENFTNHYRGMVYEAMKNPEARMHLEQANAMLSGKLMQPEQLALCLNKAGMSMDIASTITQISSNKKGLDYQADMKEHGMQVKPLESPEKPSKRVRFKAFFGNRQANRIVKDYKDAKVDRKEAARTVAMTFSDFSKEATKDSAKRTVVPKAPERQMTETPKKKSWNPFSRK